MGLIDIIVIYHLHDLNVHKYTNEVNGTQVEY